MKIMNSKYLVRVVILIPTIFMRLRKKRKGLNEVLTCRTNNTLLKFKIESCNYRMYIMYKTYYIMMVSLWMKSLNV